MNLNNLLPEKDTIRLLELSYESLFCSKEEEFNKLIGEFGNIFQNNFAIAGFAKIDANGLINNYKLVDINQWVYSCIQNKKHLNNQVFKKGFADFMCRNLHKNNICLTFIKKNFIWLKIQYWNDSNIPCPPKEFIFVRKYFKNNDYYKQIVGNLECKKDNALFLSNNLIENQFTEDTLKYIVPHLYQTFIRISNLNKADSKHNITSREKEILIWLKEGKSTWEISVILNISQNTVKFHIKNILNKLQAVNRSQAISIAFEQKLI